VLDFGAGIRTFRRSVAPEGRTVECVEPDTVAHELLPKQG
jgi:hypothetical protein